MIFELAATAAEPTASAEPPVDLGALPPPMFDPPPASDVEALTIKVASRLRCPVCQGMSVSDSPSKTAVEMKGRVRELVAQGYSEQQIIDYFVARYTDWVLLEPTFADHWAVWVVPGLGLGLGLAWVASTVLAWRKKPEALPSDVGELPKDSYEERLLRELDR